VYGPNSLGVVCTWSFGVPGIKTENRPSSDVNFAQVIALGLGVFAGGAEVFDGSFGGRSVCSCALIEEFSPSVISRTTKKTFIFDTPSFTRRFRPADYNPAMHADDTDLKAL
jgi:hypothetical protein